LEFSEIEVAIEAEIEKHRPTLPEILWHYTSSSALLGIVTTNSLWLSDYRFLNDSSEINYGIGLFKRASVQFLETTKIESHRRILTRLILELDRGLEWLRAYICSFCAIDDSINHWRFYASPGSEPLSIGFSSLRLKKLDWNPFRTRLFPIIYDLRIQKQLVELAISGFLNSQECRNYHNEGSATLERINFELFVLICCDLCIQFKNPGFATESEWRLFTRFGLERGAESELCYRTSGSGLVPYLRFSPAVGLVPICQLMLGPRISGDLQMAAHTSLLLQKEYYEVDVRRSELPLRS